MQQKRREAFQALAARLGLKYSPEDPFGTDELGFGLFGLGDRRECENMLWGEVGGMRVRLFDYTYQERHMDANGHSSTSTYRFSCGLAEVAAECPHLTLGREGVLDRLSRHLGFHDIEFESEEFNREFQVRCDDRRFASALIDPRMMEWLLSISEACQFEVSGPLILSYTHRLRPTEFELLLPVLTGFREHVPTVIGSLYPRTAEQASG